MVQKVLFAAHDVFSLFYIFSTILSSDRPQEVRLFGTDLYVSHMSYVWLIAVAVTFGLTAIVLFYHWALRVADFMCSYRCSSRTLVRIGQLPLGLLYCIPATIAALAVQLIWVGVLIGCFEPSPRQYPAVGRLYSFINYNDGLEWNERVKFMVMKYVASQEANPHVHPMTWSGAEKLEAIRVSIKECAQEKPFRARTFIYNVTIKHYFGCPSRKEVKEQVARVMGTIATTAYVVLQVFTFTFPFISFGMHFQQQNLLQQFCFVALCIPMALSLLLVPETVRYIAFLLEVRPLIWTWDQTLMNRIMLFIAEYHIPPQQAIVVLSIPQHLLPLDVAEHLSGFFGQDAVNTADLSVEECRRYKAGWNARVPVDDDNAMRNNAAVVSRDEDNVVEVEMEGRI